MKNVIEVYICDWCGRRIPNPDISENVHLCRLECMLAAQDALKEFSPDTWEGGACDEES